MHELVEALFARTGSIPTDPFTPLTIVVQSYGMGQWLKLQLAKRCGIAANIDCILPANLIWQLYQHLLDDLELPKTSPYAIERLTWLIMRLLPDCSGDQYTQVRQFLDGRGDSQVRYYQLSEKIATLYDQYLIYRPDWILKWEAGDDGAPGTWQRDLWQRINRD
ncbi:MAG: exodeoxyribonuclease V subunit gamma, partial [Pseudomonadales bacterium]